LDKLQISQNDSHAVIKKVFFFHYYFSLPERLTLFFLLSVSLIVLISFYIWFPAKWLTIFMAVNGAALVLMLGSILYTRYLAPIEGVLVHAAILYRDAGEEYAKVSDKPLPPGTKVEILDSRKQGDWLKITTQEGTLGYVKLDSIRVI
jgi:hypothetical protein